MARQLNRRYSRSPYPEQDYEPARKRPFSESDNRRRREKRHGTRSQSPTRTEFSHERSRSSSRKYDSEDRFKASSRKKSVSPSREKRESQPGATTFNTLCISSIPSIVSDPLLKVSLKENYGDFDDFSVKIIYRVQQRVAYITFRDPKEAQMAYNRGDFVMFGEKVHVDPVFKENPSDNVDGTPRCFTNDQTKEYRYVGMETTGKKFPHHLNHVDPEFDEQATRTLFVGNLEPDVKEVEVMNMFRRFGIIESIEVKRSHLKNAYAFIQFINLDCAHKAKVEMSGKKIGKFECKIGYGKVVPTPCLWVGGLEPSIGYEILFREFSRFGNIEKIEWPQNGKFAYILYSSVSEAKTAHQEMRGKRISGSDKRVRVDFANVAHMSLHEISNQLDQGRDFVIPEKMNDLKESGQVRSPYDGWKDTALIQTVSSTGIYSSINDIIRGRPRSPRMLDHYLDYHRRSEFPDFDSHEQSIDSRYDQIRLHSPELYQSFGEKEKVHFYHDLDERVDSFMGHTDSPNRTEFLGPSQEIQQNIESMKKRSTDFERDFSHQIQQSELQRPEPRLKMDIVGREIDHQSHTSSRRSRSPRYAPDHQNEHKRSESRLKMDVTGKEIDRQSHTSSRRSRSSHYAPFQQNKHGRSESRLKMDVARKEVDRKSRTSSRRSRSPRHTPNRQNEQRRSESGLKTLKTDIVGKEMDHQRRTSSRRSRSPRHAPDNQNEQKEQQRIPKHLDDDHEDDDHHHPSSSQTKIMPPLDRDVILQRHTSHQYRRRESPEFQRDLDLQPQNDDHPPRIHSSEERYGKDYMQGYIDSQRRCRSPYLQNDFQGHVGDHQSIAGRDADYGSQRTRSPEFDRELKFVNPLGEHPRRSPSPRLDKSQEFFSRTDNFRRSPPYYLDREINQRFDDSDLQRDLTVSEFDRHLTRRSDLHKRRGSPDYDNGHRYKKYSSGHPERTVSPDYIEGNTWPSYDYDHNRRRRSGSYDRKDPHNSHRKRRSQSPVYDRETDYQKRFGNREKNHLLPETYSQQNHYGSYTDCQRQEQEGSHTIERDFTCVNPRSDSHQMPQGTSFKRELEHRSRNTDYQRQSLSPEFPRNDFNLYKDCMGSPAMPNYNIVDAQIQPDGLRMTQSIDCLEERNLIAMNPDNYMYRDQFQYMAPTGNNLPINWTT